MALVSPSGKPSDLFSNIILLFFIAIGVITFSWFAETYPYYLPDRITISSVIGLLISFYLTRKSEKVICLKH